MHTCKCYMYVCLCVLNINVQKIINVIICVCVVADMSYPLFFQGHSGEVISLSFNTSGDHLVTGSFDHTVIMWDVNTGK